MIPGEKLWVDGGRHEYDLQVRPSFQHCSQQSQQKIASGVPLMHLCKHATHVQTIVIAVLLLCFCSSEQNIFWKTIRNKRTDTWTHQALQSSEERSTAKIANACREQSRQRSPFFLIGRFCPYDKVGTEPQKGATKKESVASPTRVKRYDSACLSS